VLRRARMTRTNFRHQTIPVSPSTVWPLRGDGDGPAAVGSTQGSRGGSTTLTPAQNTLEACSGRWLLARWKIEAQVLDCPSP